MRDFSKRQIWIYSFLLLVFVVLCRLPYVSSYFTHVDDVGVADTLLRASDTKQTKEFFRTKIREAQQNTGTPRAVLLARLSAAPVWPAVESTLARTYKIVSVPLEWTYAPAQFLVTASLLHPGESYRRVLFWGRIPSLIASLLGVISLFLFVFRFRGSQSFPAAILASVLMACSLENFVFSMQMSNYALGPTSLVLLLWLLWYNSENPALFARYAWLNGIILAMLFLFHYQLLPFILAFVVMLYFASAARGKDVFSLRAALSSGYAVFPFLLVFVVVYFIRFRDITAMNWNIGPSGEFAFRLPSYAPALSKLIYVMSFFVKNSFLAVWSVTSFIPEDSRASLPVGVLLSGFVLLGLVRLLRSAAQRDRQIGWFVVLSLMFWMVMVLTNKLTLSPTRHSLILLPILILLMVEGVGQVACWIRRGPDLNIILAGVVVVIFLWGLPGFMAGRQDPFDEKQISDFCRAHNVRQIAATCGVHYNLRMMPALASIPVWEFTEGAGENLSPEAVLVVARPDPFRGLLQPESLLRELPISLSSQLVGRAQLAVCRYPVGGETEFSGRTKNGYNGLLLVLFGPQPLSKENPEK